jgi:hypothetical protein
VGGGPGKSGIHIGRPGMSGDALAGRPPGAWLGESCRVVSPSPSSGASTGFVRRIHGCQVGGQREPGQEAEEDEEVEDGQAWAEEDDEEEDDEDAATNQEEGILIRSRYQASSLAG